MQVFSTFTNTTMVSRNPNNMNMLKQSTSPIKKITNQVDNIQKLMCNIMINRIRLSFKDIPTFDNITNKMNMKVLNRCDHLMPNNNFFQTIIKFIKLFFENTPVIFIKSTSRFFRNISASLNIRNHKNNSLF